MKRIFFIVLYLIVQFTVTLNAQITVSARVVDSITGEPLPFCSIQIKATTKGTITNQNGDFIIHNVSSNDSLLFSYISYAKKEIPVSTVLKTRKIKLHPNAICLNEVEIRADDLLILHILKRCKQNLKKQKDIEWSKAYLGISTLSDSIPLELLEFYMNAKTKQGSVEKLEFKNGRVGLMIKDNRYFTNQNTSKALCEISILDEKTFMPVNLLQCGEKDIRRNFNLKLSEDSESYFIQANPNNQTEFCKTYLVVDKASFELKEIVLILENTQRIPFLPLFVSDSIKNMKITTDYKFSESLEGYKLQTINFRMNYEYITVRDTQNFSGRFRVIDNISTNGVLYLYDHSKPFILPLYNYPFYLDDYRKLTLIPYNAEFWNDTLLMLNIDQKRMLGLLNKNGMTINYNITNDSVQFLDNFDRSGTNVLHGRFLFWSPDKRVWLRKSFIDTIQPEKSAHDPAFLSDLSKFNIQILLDINEKSDHFTCKTYTILDPFLSTYKLPIDTLSNVYLNMYFDLYEIERRNLQTSLNNSILSLDDINMLYKSANVKLEKEIWDFKKEVQSGKNIEGLKKWNEMIFRKIGVDNLKMFHIMI